MTTAYLPLSDGQGDHKSPREESTQSGKRTPTNAYTDAQPSAQAGAQTDPHTQSLIDAAKQAVTRAASQPVAQPDQAKTKPTIKRQTNAPFANVLNDPRHRAALEQMQKGNWDTVNIMLGKLMADYPTDEGLRLLRSEAELKTELESDWGETVKGKRTMFPAILLSV